MVRIDAEGLLGLRRVEKGGDILESTVTRRILSYARAVLPQVIRVFAASYNQCSFQLKSFVVYAPTSSELT